MLPSAGVARLDEAVGLSASQFHEGAYQTEHGIGSPVVGTARISYDC